MRICLSIQFFFYWLTKTTKMSDLDTSLQSIIEDCLPSATTALQARFLVTLWLFTGQSNRITQADKIKFSYFRLTYISVKTSWCYVPGNFTFINIQAPFRHVAHAPLWFFAGEGVKVMNIRCFICDLKVADAAVSLCEEKNSLNNLAK